MDKPGATPSAQTLEQEIQEGKGRLVHPLMMDHDPTQGPAEALAELLEQRQAARLAILLFASMQIYGHLVVRNSREGRWPSPKASGEGLETQIPEGHQSLLVAPIPRRHEDGEERFTHKGAQPFEPLKEIPPLCTKRPRRTELLLFSLGRMVAMAPAMLHPAPKDGIPSRDLQERSPAPRREPGRDESKGQGHPMPAEQVNKPGEPIAGNTHIVSPEKDGAPTPMRIKGIQAAPQLFCHRRRWVQPER